MVYFIVVVVVEEEMEGAGRPGEQGRTFANLNNVGIALFATCWLLSTLAVGNLDEPSSLSSRHQTWQKATLHGGKQTS